MSTSGSMRGGSVCLNSFRAFSQRSIRKELGGFSGARQTRLRQSVLRLMLGGTERVGWNSRVPEKSEIETGLAQVRARLAELDAERAKLQRDMAVLEGRFATELAVKQPSFENAPLTNASQSPEKIELFRSLFAGRPRPHDRGLS